MFIYLSDLGIKPETSRSNMDVYEQNITILNPITYLPLTITQKILDNISFLKMVKPLVLAGVNAWFVFHGERLVRNVTPK